jgi:branched-chain amino acid transport system substrate-binding protein
MSKAFVLVMLAALLTGTHPALAQDVVKVGLNYPKTGPYATQGADQFRAAEMAVAEINTAGGILGKRVEIVWRDSQSRKDVAIANVTDLIDDEGVQMVFGGASSGVAIAAGGVCQERGVPFFGTLTYSNATTGSDGKRFVFRECYNAWMGARAVGGYLQENFGGKKYLYITADYTWGHTTEASVRHFTGTEDVIVHKSVKIPFPGATEAEFKRALAFARMVKPDVLVLVLFGGDMVRAIRLATADGMKKRMQIVVPNLTLGMASDAGPKVMEGVIGALPWCWQVPYKYGFLRGQKFVEDYAAKYRRYPSTSGASAYTIMYEFKDAVERAGSFEGAAVVKALEGHSYQLLKDRQTWRDFDHQSVQSVYLVRCRPMAAVYRDKYRQDFFEILSRMPGDVAVQTREEWDAERQSAGKPTHLEPLPGES